MTATDELCLPNDTNELDMLLSERGQEHRVWPSGLVVWHDERTVYEYEPAKNHHDEYWGGILRMTMRHLTPEQAIAATLGAETCHVDVLNTGDCAGYECSEYIMHCNGCGHEFGHVLYNEDGDVWMSEPPNYCPNCGRKVVDE